MNTIRIDLFKKIDCCTEGYTKEDYVAFRALNEMEDEFTDNEYYQWLEDANAFEYEYLEDRLYPYFDYGVIIEGTLGLWNGTFEIEPTYINSVSKLISTCCGGNCELVSVVQIGTSHLEIEVVHHDGTNKFQAYILTPLGEHRYHNNGKVSVKNKQNVLKLTKTI